MTMRQQTNGRLMRINDRGKLKAEIGAGVRKSRALESVSNASACDVIQELTEFGNSRRATLIKYNCD